MSKRLGATKTTMFDIGGATAVKHHAFFKDIDWAKLIALQVEPPLKPELVSTTDTSNFCLDFVNMAVPRSISEDSLVSNHGTVGSRTEQAVPGLFRGFSFVADTFVDDEDWRRREHGKDSLHGIDKVDEIQNGALDAIGGTAELIPPKKVKGKRVRKKGKGKAAPPGVVHQGPPHVHAAEGEQGDSASHSSIALATPEQSVQNANLEAPCTSDVKKTTAVARARVGGGESKLSLAAMLAKQKSENPAPADSTPSAPRRPNVWGAATLPTPAPVPIPSGLPRPVGEMQKKPSLAAMLAKQEADYPPLSAAPPSRTTRTTVWSARQLPSPAPVPIPCGPPRSNVPQTKDGRAPKAGRRRPVNDTVTVTGDPSKGNAMSVWKRPV